MDAAAIAADLTRRRSEIAAELAEMTAPPEAGVNLSFGKRVGDGTSEAVERFATTATARSLAASIEQIDLVLRKIEAGTYGTCDDCDGAIGEERLAARPSAALCVECAS